MNTSHFVSKLSEQYFTGELSPVFQERLSQLPVDRQDVHQFIERVFKFCKRGNFLASDFSSLQGDILGTLLARILPGAWGGRVPPITVAGRHHVIDEYISKNQWLNIDQVNNILDLGCGFPPHTSGEMAAYFPNIQITGADPALPAYMLYDSEGNYATFDAKKTTQYFQPAIPSIENWNALLADSKATARKFERQLETLLNEGTFSTSREEGKAQLFVDPARQHEKDNLRFRLGGIGNLEIEKVDLIRCFNVLFYFDNKFRKKARDWFCDQLNEGGLLILGANWALSTESRYFVYQKFQGKLMLREFAFSTDCIAPLGLVTWYANYDEDIETGQLADLLGIIRSDTSFMKRFYSASDRLRAETGICPREDNGFYGDVSSDITPADLWKGAFQMERDLDKMGMTEEAAAVLRRVGHKTWRNEVGHIAVSGEKL